MPDLLTKTLERGWRALVRGGDPGRLDSIDEQLWTWRDDSFLAHGRVGEPLAERQPILLTVDHGNPNGAQALFLIDGADPDTLEGFERCVVLFDGADGGAVDAARAHWTRLKAAGNRVTYWRQDGRSWRREA